mmetsp:Transcript_8624/g.31879  ORF Transcript_8624/g.31879 Transcript_8624/m.31879 type:complete len:147 (+) Transcript_8624:422-862(+)
MKINVQNKAAEDFVSIMFDAFDEDKNSYIDFREYALAIGVKKNGTLEDKIKLAFNMFDIDGDGSIQYEEMVKLIASLFKMIAAKTHGDNEKIMEKMEEQAKERVDQIFSKMDANNDKSLSFDEFREGCAKDSEISRALLKVGGAGL